MALKIIAFDQSDKMWERLTSDWREEGGALLFTGSFSRQQFERGLDETVFAARTYILPEFWQELAKLLGVREKVLTFNVEEEVLAQFIADFEKLSLLSGSSLTSLIVHLQKIEYEADQDFHPTNALEEEVALLRKKLLDTGLYTQASFRTLLARRAKEIDLGYPLFVTPLLEPSRQLAGMLKGLAIKNDIFYYPLISASALEPYLERAGFSDYHLEENFSARRLSALFSQDKPGEKKSGSGEVEVSLLTSSDEVDLALDLAWRLLKKGEKSVALVVPGGESKRERLAQRAQGHGIPLVYHQASEARETLVGSLLLALFQAQKDDRLEESWLDISQDASPFYQLSLEDLEVLSQSEDFLQDILSLAERLLSGPDLPAREHMWLANALKKYEALKKEEVEIEDEEAFLLSVLTARRAYGEGLLLLTPSEVPGYQLDHILFLHLSANIYPEGVSASPFFSRELLEKVPLLKREDERYTFLPALLAARKSITLIRDSKEEPSVYFSEVMRLGFIEKYAESSLAQTTIKKMARERKEASQDIRRALAKIAPEASFEREDLRVKSDFSVTDLERYLACPLGWFVEKQIGPQKRPSFKQRHGTALHAVMEELLSYPIDEREDLISEVLDRHTDSFLSPRLRTFDKDSIKVILDKYSGPNWPFFEHRLEQFFSLEAEAGDGDIIEIRGRIDRLDLRDGSEGQEALLIDYKLNKAGGGDLLQISLYPLMAEANLGVDVLGFLYISLMQGNHRGRLKYPVPGIPAEGVSHPLKKQEGLRLAQEAISGIKGGEWFSVGNKCPSWCAHRLLSKTKEDG